MAALPPRRRLSRGAILVAVAVAVVTSVGFRARSDMTPAPNELTLADSSTGQAVAWIASVYEAERGELASLAQQLLASLSVAVAFIGTFVVATTALEDPLPSEVALLAPLVAFGIASALVGLYANSVAHSRVIQRLEAFMSVAYRDEAGHPIARGESVGGFSYGGGGVRNAHFTLIGFLTYSSAFVVLAAFTAYCLSLADPGRVLVMAGCFYQSWWLLLGISLCRAMSERRGRFLDAAALELISSNRKHIRGPESGM